jgi:tryptophan synthase beta subunit
MLKSKNGYYGKFGGAYLPELLIAPITELTRTWKIIQKDRAFQHQLREVLKNYAGRPTPLTEASHFAKAISGPRIFLKREDLLHTGAHKLNNVLGQCLLAKFMGKTRIIAETGAGQHGVATAAVCAYLGLDCVVYMGEIDMQRQAPNVSRMRLMGAEVVAVTEGSKTLKEAVNAALRDWSESFETTHYCLGSALGPHPYPEMVAQFQSIIGKEARKQCLQQIGALPEYIIACVGGGSNAIGIFSAFLADTQVKLIGVEAGGRSAQLGDHAARFRAQSCGVLHGSYSYVLQNEDGQIANTHSISAGLDYPSIGPQHAFLFDAQRVSYDAVSDEEALNAFKLLSQTEGIIPALESSHALAYVIKNAKNFDKNSAIIINLSGRGDKDLMQVCSL